MDAREARLRYLVCNVSRHFTFELLIKIRPLEISVKTNAQREGPFLATPLCISFVQKLTEGGVSGGKGFDGEGVKCLGKAKV